jgi:cell division transport system permease protein
MIWVSFKRIIRAGVASFWRNGFVSLASILVMVVTLFVVGSVVFNNDLLQSSLDELRDKVDINVYFLTTATEPDILALQKTLESFPEVKRVEYVSRADALKNFRERHKNDAPTIQGLDELDDNPLGAVLNIKAKEPSQYENVASYLKQETTLGKDGTAIIDRVNYAQNKTAIDRLTTIIISTERSSAARTLVLILISLLVSFNTIRLAIYTSREEITVMRLVGASNRYIRGPFIVAGILYGIVASFVTIAIFYPLTYYFGPLFYPLPLFLGEAFGQITLFQYFIANFGEISLIIFGAGISLGAVSSWLAVRRYLST